jgi:hypothetical protein
MSRELANTIEMIQARTEEIEANERRGVNVENLYASRLAYITKALRMGAAPGYLAEITGNGRGL